MIFEEKYAGLGMQSVELFEHVLRPGVVHQPQGDLEIQTLLRKVFNVKSFLNYPDIVCWYDVLRDAGNENHYQVMEGLHFVGALYRMSDGVELVSHFFIRRMESVRGSYSSWIDDVKFPRGTSKYSVFLLMPEEFKETERAKSDPMNQRLTQFRYDRLGAMGVDISTIIDYMKSEEFRKFPRE